MLPQMKNFRKCIEFVMDLDDCHWQDEVASEAAVNTLALNKNNLGVLYPRSVEQIRKILVVAAVHRVSIHTVSQGKNIGYGEMTPQENDQLVLNLRYLNKIKDFDRQGGTVVVEPGVTQMQLSIFLKEHGGIYWADMTGASPNASIVGNTIEAGFGHSPLGDHRKHILAMEVMLYNGKTVNTLEMPNAGPDLSQIFVQTNLGIVTAIKIPLLRVPESTRTFTITFESDEQLMNGIDVFRDLQSKGVLESLVHIANSTRSLMTSFSFPEEFSKKTVLSEPTCRKILSTRLGIDTGAWTAVGCLYGFKGEVNEKSAILEKSFARFGIVRFFSDRKLRLIESILNLRFIRNLQKVKMVKRSIKALKAVHEIMRGAPSSVPSENILWRVDSFSKCGLIWHSPVVKNSGDQVMDLINNHRSIFAKYGFEMPLTLTLINPRKIIAVFNINFDRSNSYDVKRAHDAYLCLSEAARKKNCLSYRYSLLGQPRANSKNELDKILLGLKRMLDPLNMLAPGRYGLSLDNDSEAKHNQSPPIKNSQQLRTGVHRT